MSAIEATAIAPYATVVLPEVLDTQSAARIASELVETRGRDLTVDASNVRRLGGQCLQVLLAAHACWKAEGLSFRVKPSAEFQDALALLGAPAFDPIKTV